MTWQAERGKQIYQVHPHPQMLTTSSSCFITHHLAPIALALNIAKLVGQVMDDFTWVAMQVHPECASQAGRTFETIAQILKINIY